MAKQHKPVKNEENRAQPQKVVRDCIIDRNCLDDLLWWAEKNPKITAKALALMEQVLRAPFTGTCKPEPLKGIGSNTWSRRLTQEHRLVYAVFDDRINFLMARYHY